MKEVIHDHKSTAQHHFSLFSLSSLWCLWKRWCYSQTKKGVNWFSKQNELLKLELQKLLLYASYHKTFINRTQLILNQSTLYTKSFIKVLSFTKILNIKYRISIPLVCTSSSSSDLHGFLYKMSQEVLDQLTQASFTLLGKLVA